MVIKKEAKKILEELREYTKETTEESLDRKAKVLVPKGYKSVLIDGDVLYILPEKDYKKIFNQ